MANGKWKMENRLSAFDRINFSFSICHLSFAFFLAKGSSLILDKLCTPAQAGSRLRL